MNDLKIKIFCRSFNLELYTLSKKLYESWGFPCVRLTDQTADGYFYTILRDTDCDIAINIDEDCFVTSRDAVIRLIEYVIDNGFANAGCPEIGSGLPGERTPKVTNPFFNIFDLRIIRAKFTTHAITSYMGYYPEPYYPFFLWSLDNINTYYITNKKHHDGLTTILYNPQGEELCRHTWLARFYSTPAFIVKHWMPKAGAQKKRIDTVINEVYQLQNIVRPKFGTKDKLRFLSNSIIRWIIKVPQRIIGWPKKIKAKLSSGK